MHYHRGQQQLHYELIQRELPPQQEPEASLDQRLDTLSVQMDALHGHVEQMLSIYKEEDTNEGPGVGHNNPPEPLQEEASLDEILSTIREVKAELAKADAAKSADVEVVARAQSRFESLLVWINEVKAKARVAIPVGILSGASGYVGKLLCEYVVQHHSEIEAAIVTSLHIISAWIAVLTMII